MYGHSLEDLQTDAMQLVQTATAFEQLTIALSNSADGMASAQAAMSETVSDAAALVASKAAVPKNEVLPMFYQLGQLFQVCLHHSCQVMFIDLLCAACHWLLYQRGR